MRLMHSIAPVGGRVSCGPLAATQPLLSGCFQVASRPAWITSPTPPEHIFRRDVADGAVQSDIVVMLDVTPPPDTAHTQVTAAFPAGMATANGVTGRWQNHLAVLSPTR